MQHASSSYDAVSVIPHRVMRFTILFIYLFFCGRVWRTNGGVANLRSLIVSVPRPHIITAPPRTSISGLDSTYQKGRKTE
jgi:hypothetical protein